MTIVFKNAWQGFVLPLVRRPKRLQVAALCYRREEGIVKVLMITSRGTGRWIIPKGWPVRGMDACESALQEAWEEAGVHKAALHDGVLGTYTYQKVKDTGWEQPVEVLVYAARVEKMKDKYPEADQRKRQWVSPSEAAGLVDEPELKAILQDFV